MSRQYIVLYVMSGSSRMKKLHNPNRPSRVLLFDSREAAARAAEAIEDATGYWVWEAVPPLRSHQPLRPAHDGKAHTS